ncbi:protein mono-ADP-ribosyltransferase PARP11-like [Ptychodera flava]|uniref:protein mono-ADP-ribosyltransferase PARP11-like n=1 Tax=Ptychodera flava TaxID=63121 RepID=UPI00396A12E6
MDRGGRGLSDLQETFVGIRRLSTPSYAIDHSSAMDSNLTTSWKWYWQDNGNTWVPYSNNSAGLGQANSDDIESAYQSEKDTFYFNAGDYRYMLSFRSMRQTNLQTRTTREVRRRPVFVSPKSIDGRLSRLKGTNHLQSDATIYPSSWEPMPPGKEFIRCLLNTSSAEFKFVESVFRKSMQQHKAKINSIQRVQNPHIWDKYQRQKKYMVQKNGDTGLQVNLFHGTDEQSVPKICRQNFDFRVAGKNATLFGHGTYFARDASYSDRYSSDDDHGQRHMFFAYVLVGRYTVGQSSYKRPPEINQHTGELYDSCVNRQNDPTVFVIFDREQCYPAYLINFTKLNANRGPPSAAIGLKGTNHLQSDATIYPSSWEPMPPGKEFIRCLLNTSSAEFQFVERVFRKSMQQHKAKINAIERIQNPLTWTNIKDRSVRILSSTL